MKCETYEDVAFEAGLGNSCSQRYVKYMRKRWPEDESQKSLDGYAGEWAYRFKGGVEYGASDLHGKQVLRDMTIEYWSSMDGKPYKLVEITPSL